MTYPWSSYPAYLSSPRKRTAWLRVDRVLGEHGIQRDDARGRREFGRRLESQRQTTEASDLAVMRTGWRLGGEDFLDRILEKWDGKLREHHGGKESWKRTWSAHGVWSRASWRGLAGRAKQFATERKGHAVKVAVARRLREETTMSMEWIAAELQMGTWTHLNRLLNDAK